MAADDVSGLEKLAGEMGRLGYNTHLIIPQGEAAQKPSLVVTNPNASALTERVMTDGVAYWWPWAQKIGPVGDVAGAAEKVASVLRAGEGNASL